MSDGAFLGVDAERALGTILSGKPNPTQEERMTDEQFAAWLRSAEDASSYGECARLAGRYLLEYLERHPEHQSWPLDDKYDFKRAEAAGVTEFYSDEALRPYIIQQGIWNLACAEQPALAQLDLTGFMAGWAFNAARKVLNLGPVQNPALLTINV